MNPNGRYAIVMYVSIPIFSFCSTPRTDVIYSHQYFFFPSLVIRLLLLVNVNFVRLAAKLKCGSLPVVYIVCQNLQ